MNNKGNLIKGISTELQDIILALLIFDNEMYDASKEVMSEQFFYGDEYKGKMILRDHIYHIDCGLVYGFSLGCLCLDTMQEFYIQKKD